MDVSLTLPGPAALPAVPDKCGVCDGGNLDIGCDGVCFSEKQEDCRGVCGGTARVDQCGVCDGNNKDLVRTGAHRCPRSIQKAGSRPGKGLSR